MKKKLVAFIFVPLWLPLCFSLTSLARADDASIQGFFATAQGDYSGSGETRAFSATGETDTSYDIDLQASVSDDGALVLDGQTDTDGLNGSSHVVLRLSGGTLYYSTATAGSAIPVRVLESTDCVLDYSFDLAGYDGRIYSVENRYSISTGALSARETVSVNGAVIQDDAFDISRL